MRLMDCIRSWDSYMGSDMHLHEQIYMLVDFN
jgi:hypothetical protein